METAVAVKDFTLRRGSFLLKSINLTVRKNEILAIIGKTGAGKTMLLEAISGAYGEKKGRIFVSGTDVLSVPVEKRGIGFVYQDYGLFPHMTVYQNISYGLRMRKTPKESIKEKVEHIAQLLSIQHILNCWPATLSGGECQRTALARSLIVNPRLLLLDEPFSALDPVTRDKMHELLLDIHQKFNCTIIFVSHDFKEAASLAERVGVMIDGELIEVRNCKDLFLPYEDERANEFLGINQKERRVE
ncbi:ATP-binding cassette domain-containing protein [Parasporobacterium paucivorans]|uniref:Molybdate transport system ATP-binding protein n=1 Tax=Parasporobacterium paucivorans DSM 15970 TaxID=1122934 RepID=A0A1M6I5I8_9FIRM|nr:ATP-binding cassette domain-containing protein [Parasporobacterium paucivorans]SHJ29698.1 molybdate transport system ATP-binding protein [Parasporobacterium paucivorans DSM 15970]